MFLPKLLKFQLVLPPLAIIAAAGWVLAREAERPAPALGVTVNYTVEGAAVDVQHQIYVWLFDDPNFSSGGALPIASATIDSNGGSASFGDPGVPTVYVALAYDEAGEGIFGPPPSGTPVSSYSSDQSPGPAPVDLKQGETVRIEVAFDDSFRMP